MPFNSATDNKSQSDRMYELLNQKSFGYMSDKRKGGVEACDTDYNNISRCNTKETASYSRKYTSPILVHTNGKPSSVITSSQNTERIAVDRLTCTSCDSDDEDNVNQKRSSYARYLAKQKKDKI